MDITYPALMLAISNLVVIVCFTEDNKKVMYRNFNESKKAKFNYIVINTTIMLYTP